jgi:integrase
MGLTGTGRNFAAWLTERHYAPATIAVYVGYAQRAEHALGGLLGASADELYDWWTTLPPSASSRNGARKALVAFYRAIGHRTGGPALELPSLPAPEGHPRPVAGPAFDRLRAAAARIGGVHHVAAVLLGTTGCRISEARLARWDTFVFDGSASTWRVAGKGSGRRGVKHRDVPLTTAAVAVLGRWRPECRSRTFVFPSPVHPGRPVSDSTMRAVVYEIAAAAGVDEHVNPHRWRHTAATAALDHTKDLAAVQDMLGHQDPATTRRYTKVGWERMRAAVDGAANYGKLRAV